MLTQIRSVILIGSLFQCTKLQRIIHTPTIVGYPDCNSLSDLWSINFIPFFNACWWNFWCDLKCFSFEAPWFNLLCNLTIYKHDSLKSRTLPLFSSQPHTLVWFWSILELHNLIQFLTHSLHLSHFYPCSQGHGPKHEMGMQRKNWLALCSNVFCVRCHLTSGKCKWCVDTISKLPSQEFWLKKKIQ